MKLLLHCGMCCLITMMVGLGDAAIVTGLHVGAKLPLSVSFAVAVAANLVLVLLLLAMLVVARMMNAATNDRMAQMANRPEVGLEPALAPVLFCSVFCTCTVQCCIALCCTVLYRTVSYFIMVYRAICIAAFCITADRIIPHYLMVVQCTHVLRYAVVHRPSSWIRSWKP